MHVKKIQAFSVLSLSLICSLSLLSVFMNPNMAKAANPGAQQLSRGLDYAYWNFQNITEGFWNIDQSVLIEQKGDYTFWAMQFNFSGSGDAGYMGLQTNGVRWDGTNGEQAIFSLWNGNGASGASCDVFSGEGTGYSCRVNFAIQSGEWYKYRVWRLETDTVGQWWGAWIISSDGTETFIGKIRVPVDGHQTMDGVIDFREYFGPTLACPQQPDSISDFLPPAANSQGNGNYQFTSVAAGIGKGGCFQETPVAPPPSTPAPAPAPGNPPPTDPAPAPAPAPGDAAPAQLSNLLMPGQTLGPDGGLLSADGHYILSMQSDGNLVLYSTPNALWASNTRGFDGADLEMQGDGNLVVYAPGHQAVWNSGTAGHPGAYLVLQNDANLVVVAPDGTPLWNAGSVDSELYPDQRLNPGWQIQSPDRRFNMVMQQDGNLVVYAGPTALWATNTYYVGSDLEMQSDGNLVVYAPGHQAVWSSGTNNGAPNVFVAQNDGNFVIYAPGHSALWSTNTMQANAGPSVPTGTSDPGAPPVNPGSGNDLTTCPNLSQGMNGQCITLLQSDLNIAGANPKLAEDGQFGPATFQAVIDFQKNNNLTIDGIAGPQTITALFNVLSVPTPTILPNHNYPASFNPTKAAEWAEKFYNNEAPDQVKSDPCTQFVSRALHYGGGLPLDNSWFPKTDTAKELLNFGHDSKEWYNATSLKNRLVKKGWVQASRPVRPGQIVTGSLGDLVYYQWKGLDDTVHVHMAIVTGFEANGNILISGQGGFDPNINGYVYDHNLQWDIDHRNVKLSDYKDPAYSDIEVTILHW